MACPCLVQLFGNFGRMPLVEPGFLFSEPAVHLRSAFFVEELPGMNEMLFGMIPINDLFTVIKMLSGQVPRADPHCSIPDHLAVRRPRPPPSFGFGPHPLSKLFRVSQMGYIAVVNRPPHIHFFLRCFIPAGFLTHFKYTYCFDFFPAFLAQVDQKSIHRHPYALVFQAFPRHDPLAQLHYLCPGLFLLLGLAIGFASLLHPLPATAARSVDPAHLLQNLCGTGKIGEPTQPHAEMPHRFTIGPPHFGQRSSTGCTLS